MKDTKLILVSLLIVTVVVGSSIGFSWIVHEESRTGGMGEKWEMPVNRNYNPQMDLLMQDGSIVFIDSEHNLISLVDNNGVVRWSANYGNESTYPQIIDGDICFIDISDAGNYTLDRISLDGVYRSSSPCPPIYNFIAGDDGRIYASWYANNDTISSIYSIEGGSVIWNFTANGSLSLIKVWENGMVLLKQVGRHIISNNFSQGTIVDSEDIIMMDPNGTEEWRMSFPHDDGYYYSSDVSVAGNGTIVLDRVNPDWKQTLGYDGSGDLMWTSNESIDQSAQLYTYFGCQALVGNDLHRYVESVYKVDRANDSNSWIIYLNDTWGGTLYSLNGTMIFMSSDGQAFGLDPNGSILWHISTEVIGTTSGNIDPGTGVLVISDNAVTMIGKNGTFWTCDGIDSPILGTRMGANGTVYVLTDSKLEVLYKPTVSMPSEYLIAMISVDLLIALSCGLYVADRLVKKSN